MVRRKLPVIVGAFLLHSALHSFLHAASMIPPKNLGELSRASDAVVLARAEGASSEMRGALIFTEVEFSVETVVAGDLGRGEPVFVECPGGEAGGKAWVVASSPRFAAGQTYLLFLHRKSEGTWIPLMQSYGVLRETSDANGVSYLVPISGGGAFVLGRPDARSAEPIVPYHRDGLIEHLRGVASGQTAWSSASVEARPADGAVAEAA